MLYQLSYLAIEVVNARSYQTFQVGIGVGLAVARPTVGWRFTGLRAASHARARGFTTTDPEELVRLKDRGLREER